MGLSTGAMMAIGMIGSAVVGSMLAPEAPTAAPAAAAPAVAAPKPIPVSPDLDPKKRAKAEQSMLSAGLSGNAPLSREDTLLGGGGTLG